MAYGTDLKIVRSEQERAKRAAWYRAYYAKSLKHLHMGKRGKKTDPNTPIRKAARAAARKEEAQHTANIREFICKACGNHRLFVPDIGEGNRRRCSVCAKQKRMAYKVRAKASGKWGVQCRLKKHRRRAMKRANGGAGHVTAQDWRDILAKYGSACLCCGSTAPPTMDHVVPLAQGGPHDKSNLQPLCMSCNNLKRTAIVDYRPDRPLAPMRRDPRNVRYVHGTD